MNRDETKWLLAPLKNDTGSRQVIFIKQKDGSYRGLIKESGNRYQSSFIDITNLISYIKRFNLKKADSVDKDLQHWAVAFILSL